MSAPVSAPVVLRASSACAACGERFVVDVTCGLEALPDGTYSLAGAQPKVAARETATFECTVCGATGRALPLGPLAQLKALPVAQCGHRAAATHYPGEGHDGTVCTGCCLACQTEHMARKNRAAQPDPTTRRIP
ncbi:hypothetical protein [Actinomadura violacea]|uniref:Uncharacterized protein n=1 Tax=Actinomadura violacea TaxID=2819934 RepID=A0ABS3RYA2_9ACTN|nr:hypothetical protein [Actinomadura violacea]MBO2461743.1 hypothetical protein [Actinomadura violacea]